MKCSKRKQLLLQSVPQHCWSIFIM